MKRTTLTLLFACIVSMSFAQTERGSIFIGGNSKLDFSTNSNIEKSGSDTYQLDFSPRVGYFIFNGMVVGLQIPIQYVKETSDYSSDEAHSVGIAPFIRHYWSSAKIKPYIDASIGLGVIKSNYTLTSGSFYSSSSHTSKNELMINFGVGLAYWITKNVSLESGLKFNYTSYDFGGSNPVNTRGAGLNIGIAVSI